MTANDLSARLQEMLRLGTSNDANATSSSRTRPPIEAVDSKSRRSDGPREIGAGRSNRGGEDDGDDEPPPLCPRRPLRPISASADRTDSNGGLSLAERMMRDADEANRAKKRDESSRRRQNARKASFGVKKGFLNGPSKTSKKSQNKDESKSSSETAATVQQQKSQTSNNLIYELDNQGNVIPVQNNQSTSNNQSPLLNLLPKSNPSWATDPSLLQSISNNPKLIQGMNNPRFMAALSTMQASSSPKETFEKFKEEEPEVLEFVREFCAVMGEHFCRLGQDREGRVGSECAVHAKAGEERVREMGVLEERAMRRHKHRRHQEMQRKNENDQPISSCNQLQRDNSGMDEQVSAVLSDPRLRSILMDPKMQCIMDECSNGSSNKLGYYMRDEEIGPKLRLLIEAGLLRVA